MKMISTRRLNERNLPSTASTHRSPRPAAPPADTSGQTNLIAFGWRLCSELSAAVGLVFKPVRVQTFRRSGKGVPAPPLGGRRVENSDSTTHRGDSG